MSTVNRVQNAISKIEGFQIRIVYEGGRDVRDDRSDLPIQWNKRAAKGDLTVAAWTSSRFKAMYPGFAVQVLDSGGRAVHGRMKLSTVRASYD